ncbi:TolC family outer membrane protein [Uliginosibacterium gangwonense]|uniref:TolC family outer membrane protein n=1 Tax=Uliginosibacterium gangwonense TaxID=392736 RepID=UPI00037DEB0E|nr:TolC family outer membrane protein [Uliginosibacterium gangwonense]
MKQLLVLMMLSGVVSSATAADLLDTYREAYGADAKLASARSQLEAGREKAPQARAALLPSVALTASSSYSSYSMTEPVVRDAHYNTNTYGVQLTQPLFNMQSVIAAKQGDIAVNIAEAQYANALIDLMQRTAQAYFDVLYAEDTLSSVQALKTAANEQLQLAKKSFEVGTVTITDVNEAQSRFDLASAQEIAAQNDISVKRQALRLITGHEPGELAHLRTGLNIAPPLPANMEDWVSAAERDNVDVQAQKLAVENATRETERARAGHLPTVSVTAGYNNSHATGSISSASPSLYNGWSVGLNFSMPLYQGGGIQSKVRESAALEDKARSDLDLTKRTAAQTVRQSFLGVTNGIAQIKGYEAALISSQSALDSNKLGYQVGMRINIDVLNAQSQLADTQQKLARVRYDAILSQLKLKAAVGALSVPDLEDINNLLAH